MLVTCKPKYKKSNAKYSTETLAYTGEKKKRKKKKDKKKKMKK